MRISENQLDNLTHTLIGQLAAYGVDIDSDQAADLNDLLEDFIVEKCQLELTPSEKTDDVIQITFDIMSGQVDQQIKVVNNSYDKDMIIEGLNSGFLVTTTWLEQGGIQTIDITSSGEVVAEILSQEINAEYYDYR